MNSVIFQTVHRLLAGLLLIFSFFLLLRGHNLPGGGFAGGLVAASALALQSLAYGIPSARRTLGVSPRALISAGLLTAIGSGLWPMVYGLPFLTGLWEKTPLPVLGKAGTPLLFDFGVYLVVAGIVSLIVFSLGEED